MQSYPKARLRFSVSVAVSPAKPTADVPWTGVALCTAKRLQQFAIDLVNFFAPKNEDHFLDPLLGREKFAGSSQRDLRRFLNRITVRATTDRGKPYRFDSVFHRQLQRIPVAICEFLRLAMFPAAPNGSDRVNDKSSGQTVAASNFRFAKPTTA